MVKGGRIEANSLGSSLFGVDVLSDDQLRYTRGLDLFVPMITLFSPTDRKENEFARESMW